MNVLTSSLFLLCASSPSSPGCEVDVALLQLNSRAGSSYFTSSQATEGGSLSPLERIGPNVHRHKLAFSEANATVSTTEPSYRELAGYWTDGSGAAAQSDSHRPPTPSEAKAMLNEDQQIMGYSYEKSHPDIAYVRTSGATFVPSNDWVSVLRVNDDSTDPAVSVPAGTATQATAKQVSLAAAEVSTHAMTASSPEDDTSGVLNSENPPPDNAPQKADEGESVEPAGEEDRDAPYLRPEAPGGEDLNATNATDPPATNETEYPKSLATGAAIGLLFAFCE